MCNNIITYLYIHTHHLQGSVSETKCLIENYHLFSDNEFIKYLKSKANVLPKDNSKIQYESKINDPVNVFGDTILHYAVFHNKVALIDFLLSNNADPFKKNNVTTTHTYIYITITFINVYRDNKVRMILHKRKE